MRTDPIKTGYIFRIRSHAARWGQNTAYGRMLAARVEQKNGMTKDDKNGVMPLDKESPIQAWFARLIAANGRLPSDHRAANRRAPVRQGQVFGGAEDAPSLAAAARDDDGKSGRGGRMLAARVEQKNGMTKDDKNGVMPLDKESPIQAPYKRSRRKNARGAGRTKEWNDKGRQEWRDAP